jgi:hypothetical protein
MRDLWIVRKLRLTSYRSRSIYWTATGDPLLPFGATEGETRLRIRVNDFPDEPLYSLLVNDQELGRFSNWPAKWRKPSIS